MHCSLTRPFRSHVRGCCCVPIVCWRPGNPCCSFYECLAGCYSFVVHRWTYSATVSASFGCLGRVDSVVQTAPGNLVQLPSSLVAGSAKSTTGAGTSGSSLSASARASPFEAAVVIPRRRDGRPVRPASTVASLQSKSAVERENPSDDVVLGAGSGESSSVLLVKMRVMASYMVFRRRLSRPWLLARKLVLPNLPRQQRPSRPNPQKLLRLLRRSSPTRLSRSRPQVGSPVRLRPSVLGALKARPLLAVSSRRPRLPRNILTRRSRCWIPRSQLRASRSAGL